MHKHMLYYILQYMYIHIYKYVHPHTEIITFTFTFINITDTRNVCMEKIQYICLQKFVRYLS